MAPLNAFAPEFTPSRALDIPLPQSVDLPEDPFGHEAELSISPEDLEELKDVDNWIRMMAAIDLQEDEEFGFLAANESAAFAAGVYSR